MLTTLYGLQEALNTLDPPVIPRGRWRVKNPHFLVEKLTHRELKGQLQSDEAEN